MLSKFALLMNSNNSFEFCGPMYNVGLLFYIILY